MKWSDQDTATMQHLAALGQTDQEIGDAMGRSRHSVRDYLRWSRMTEQQKQVKRERRNRLALERKTEKQIKRSVSALTFGERIIDRPSADLLRERDRRLAIPPRDLTAEFFGDPRPGFSALERRA